jgi:hypothetical protein
MHSGTSARCTRRTGTLGLALACLVLGGPPASACSWWWGCDEGRSRYRPPARVYRYNGYGYNGYNGFGGPPRAYRYAPFNYYTGLPSTHLYRYPVSGPQQPDAGATGLTPPVATFDGISTGAVPAQGPTLLGPPAPPAGTYGYNPVLGYYSGYAYYGPPGFYTYTGPPPPTAWLERRRRR